MSFLANKKFNTEHFIMLIFSILQIKVLREFNGSLNSLTDPEFCGSRIGIFPMNHRVRIEILPKTKFLFIGSD